mmetsp:Transcript_1029/g.3209  ORF Transcript_1029/g.3209 Transcript_1029/m.3209 type:complete len:297 (-) Transcript_1029:99-989(-)
MHFTRPRMAAPMEHLTTFRSYTSMEFLNETSVDTPKASIVRKITPTFCGSRTPSKITTCGPVLRVVSAPAVISRVSSNIMGNANTLMTPCATFLEVPRVALSNNSSDKMQTLGGSPALPESLTGPACHGTVAALEDVPIPSSPPLSSEASISLPISSHRLFRTKTARGRMRRNVKPSATNRRLRWRSARRSTKHFSSRNAGLLADETTVLCGAACGGSHVQLPARSCLARRGLRTAALLPLMMRLRRCWRLLMTRLRAAAASRAKTLDRGRCSGSCARLAGAAARAPQKALPLLTW